MRSACLHQPSLYSAAECNWAVDLVTGPDYPALGQQPYTHREQNIVIWAGLKGGLSLAMALSIPHIPVKEPIVFITYAIVLFSIIIQGLTIEWVAKRNT